MRIIGLTGGIASGKSSVGRYLESNNVPLIDCDKIARLVVEPKTKTLKKIVKFFGPGILNQNGTLNRAALGDLIFNDTQSRMMLNKITHPAIMREVISQIIECWLRACPIVVVDAALLFESGLHHYVSKTVVVFCPENIQIERLLSRDQLTEIEAKARIQAQGTTQSKLSRASLILDNTGSLDDLHQKVDLMIQKYKPGHFHTFAWLLGPFLVLILLIYHLIKLIF